MAFSLVFTLLSLSAVSLASNVPVYIWGDLAKTSLTSSPLYTVETEEFSGILKEELSKDPFTVIFIEETLSVEDFSRKNEGKTSFPFLRDNIRNSAYLPSVENALSALNKLADPEKVNHVKLTENGLSAEIEPESGKFLFINLKDAREGESRFDLLRRHNDFMEDMYNKLQERYNKVVAVYTAHFPSWTVSHSRIRRQANETLEEGSTIMFEGLLIAVSDITVYNGTDMTVFTGITGSSTFNNETKTQNSTLTSGKFSIVLHFTQDQDYWILYNVTYSNMTTTPAVEEVLLSTRDVSIPLGFSYRCAPNVTFASANVTQAITVSFGNMKIQPYFNDSATDLVFGDSINCVGFFSAPIWAALFVTFILLFIMFFGVIMMMDIRTMDRFDDPKGKTITINAGE